MTWHEHAACRGIPTRLFVPDVDHRSRGNKGLIHYAEAKAICARCPVTSECLDYALRHEVGNMRYGCFGGLAPEERRRLNIRRQRQERAS